MHYVRLYFFKLWKHCWMFLYWRICNTNPTQIDIPIGILCYLALLRMMGAICWIIVKLYDMHNIPKHSMETPFIFNLRCFKSKNTVGAVILTCAGITVIKMAVFPGWGLSIAPRTGWPLRSLMVMRAHNLWVWGSAFALITDKSKCKRLIPNLVLTPEP